MCFFNFILDNLIRNHLVNHAEELLKTEVSISKVKLSLLGDTIIEDIEINISNTTNFSFSVNYPEVMESTMSVEFTAVDQGNGDATESFNVELTVIESPDGDTYAVEDVVHFGEITPVIDFTGVSFCANGLPANIL